MADLIPGSVIKTSRMYCWNCGTSIISYEDEVKCRHCGSINIFDNGIWMEDARLIKVKYEEKLAYEKEVAEYISNGVKY